MKTIRLLAIAGLALGASSLTAQSIQIQLHGSGAYDSGGIAETGATGVNPAGYTDVELFSSFHFTVTPDAAAFAAASETMVRWDLTGILTFTFTGIEPAVGNPNYFQTIVTLSDFGLSDPLPLFENMSLLDIEAAVDPIVDTLFAGGVSLPVGTDLALHFGNGAGLNFPPYTGQFDIVATDADPLFAFINDASNGGAGFELPYGRTAADIGWTGNFVLSAVPVPEPATIGMLGVGSLLGLAIVRRRFKKAAK